MPPAIAHFAIAPLDDPASLPCEYEAGEFAAEIASVAAQAQVPPWCSYLAYDGGDAVGFGGFKAPVDSAGDAEIGYLTFRGHEGRGIASAFAAFLADTARGAGARSMSAHTLPESNASTRVLEKCGFERNGWGDDDDVGRVWRWRLPL